MTDVERVVSTMRLLISCLHLLCILHQVSSCRLPLPGAHLIVDGACVLATAYNASDETEAEYSAAKAFCTTRDTTLLIILSRSDNEAFAEIDNGNRKNLFIGLECNMTTHRYVWADGSPVGYTNFADGRNSTFCNSTEHFIVKRDDNTLKWIPFKHQSLGNGPMGRCMEPRLSISNPCDDYDALPGTDTCFSLIKANVTWDDAEFYCMQDAAHLISIHSREQNEYLRTYALSHGVSTKFHIGLQAPVVSHHLTVGDFTWVDGSKKNYSQLNDWSIFGHCTAMYTNQTKNNWLSDGCDGNTNLAAYMCSRPAFSSSPSTPTTCPSNSTIFKEGDIITSPGFPNGYPHIKCTYNIRVAEGKRAQVEVLLVETSWYDFLTIREAKWFENQLFGANDAGRLISAFPDDANPICRNCTINSLTMDWCPRNGVNVRGWKIRVNAVDP